MKKWSEEESIEALLHQMTLKEKINMIHGAGLFRTGSVDRLGIPALTMSDGPMGVRAEFKDTEWKMAGNNDDFVTYCPSNSAIASSWNRELAERCGKILGEEARGRAKDVILAPGINIKRSPLCGRNFEYFSEEPFLVSELAVAMIEGIESTDTAACVKHFALNNQETERLWVNVEVDERTMREIYLPGFEAAVKKAHVKSVMAAYNLFHGVHCCHSRELLDVLLRKEWGYDGVIISDWGGVHDTKSAAESPLDIEMSVTPDFDDYFMAEPLYQAVEKHEVDESLIDEKVRNILRLMLRIRKIEIVCGDENRKAYAVPCKTRQRGAFNTPAHRTAVLEAARESIILLKNENGRLPLKREKLKKLLVIGDNAVRQHSFGGGSAEIKSLYEVCPLMGLKMLLGGNCEVTWTPGYYVPKKEESGYNWQKDSLNSTARVEKKISEAEQAERERLLREAAILASEYEQVLFVGGLNHEEDVEGYDRENMTLPYGQNQLIQELLKVNPHMVIVMAAGNPVDMSVWADRAEAVVWMGYCGMEGGTALAEILLGDVNPSGKLAETLPRCLEDTPALRFGDFPGRKLNQEEKARMDAHLTQTYREGIMVGYRYYEKYRVPVRFCFGHGLSYTEFSYRNLRAQWTERERGERILSVNVDISNTGNREGKETVELYIGETDIKEEDAVKELKGFQKIALAPGESRKVEIQVEERALCKFDVEKNCFVQKDGPFEVNVGSSLADIRGKVIIYR